MISKKWGNLPFTTKTLILVLILVSFSVVTGVRYHMLVNEISEKSVEQSSNLMLEGHKNKLKDITDMMAITLDSAVKGMNNEDEVYTTFKSLIQDARFLPDESGYMFIYKKGGTVFVLPPTPEREGKNLIDFKDANGKLLIKELDDIAAVGGGFVEYLWDKPGQGIKPKLAYARMMPGDKYWIGTGVYVDDIQKQRQSIESTTSKLVSSALQSLYITLAVIAVVIALPLIILLIRSMINPIRELTSIADEFSRGKMDLTIPHVDRSDEIGLLANALKRLGMSVKVAMKSLKKGK